MKAQELIDVLSLNPDAEVFSIRQWYDGDSDQREIDNVAVITNGDSFVIVPNELYTKAEAIAYAGSHKYFPDWRSCFELAKSEESIIMVD